MCPVIAVKLSEFNYDLPPELIAQEPLPSRASSRLFVMDRKKGGFLHRAFADLPSFLRKGDVLLINESRVIPARLRLVRGGSGGKVEVLLLRSRGLGDWEAQLKPSARMRPGQRLVRADSPEQVILTVAGQTGEGRWTVREGDGAGGNLLGLGEAPLPPYIKREPGGRQRAYDLERYQTVYARVPGSVAAPTAGLHFTEEMLSAVRGAGADIARFSLHVGMGTFSPVRAEADISGHRMEPERYEISPESVQALKGVRDRGGRMVAVGTTGVRVLETIGPALDSLAGTGASGETGLFITPGFEFRFTGAMLTNFHLPKSTPFILLAALAGLEPVRKAYAEAVRERYRFLSYGDAMLVI